MELFRLPLSPSPLAFVWSVRGRADPDVSERLPPHELSMLLL